MNEMQVFNNVEFGQLRTITENGKTIYCGVDIARPLQYARPGEAVMRHCKGTLKRRILTNGGEQELIFITEGDVYRLIARSKMPAAERFESWVFDEVLPSIHKTGGYITGQSIMEKYSNPRELAKLLNDYADAQDKNAALEATIEANKPKVDFAEALLVCENCNYIEELAKLLCQIGMKTGRNRLFEEMGEDGFLCTRNGVKNMPTQKCVESGWLAIEKTVYEKNGKKQMGYTTKVTPKGMQYFMEYYRRKHGLEPLLTINRRTVIEQRRAPRQLKAGHGMIGQ